MILSAEKFQSIVESLRSDAVCGRNAEQRAEPRVGMWGQISIVLRTGDGVSRRSVRVRDVSVGGIGVLSEHRVEPGTTFLVEMEGAWSRTTLGCRAVRCQSLGNGLFRIGARFERCSEARARPATVTERADPGPGTPAAPLPADAPPANAA